MSRKKRRGRRTQAAPMDPAKGRLVAEGLFPASLFPGDQTDAEAAGQTAVMQLAYLEDRLEEILAGSRDDGADAVLSTSTGGGSELILYMGHDLCLVRGVVKDAADRGELKVLFRYAWLTRRAGTSMVQDAASPLEEALDEALRVAGRGDPAVMPNIVAKWVREAQAAPAAHLAGALFRFYAIARHALGPATFNLPDSPDSEFSTACWIEGVLTALARQAAGLDLMPDKGPPGAVPEMLVVQTRMEDTEQECETHGPSVPPAGARPDKGAGGAPTERHHSKGVEPRNSIPEKPPRTATEVIADIETLCQEPGYLYAYAVMVCENLFIPQHAIATVDWHDRLNEGEMSWILGMMVKHEWDLHVSPSEHSVKAHMATTWGLMQELHQSLLSSVSPHANSAEEAATSRPVDVQALQDWLGSGVRFTEAIFYTELGAYDFQQLDFAKRRYALDSRWIESHLDASVETLVEIAQRVTNLLSDRVNQRERTPSFVEYCADCVSMLSFSKEDIFGGTLDIADRVLNKFSCIPGSANQDFGPIGTYNVVHSHPLIRLGQDRYFFPLTFNFARAIYESPTYWMRDDSGYYETAMSNRGSTTESIAYDLLSKSFGQQNVYRNVKVQKGKTDLSEIDVLAICGNKAIIVQAKSKSLTALSRQGNADSLREDFKAAIQKAYAQGIVCRSALLTQSVRLRDECGQLIHLPFDIDDAYIVCLTGDHYPAVLAQCNAYLEKQPSDPYPVALSIFDLDVLVFYLSDPFEFTYYLRQRSLFAEHFLADSELALLGFHLCKRLAAAEGYDLVWVTGDYGQLIDAHFPIAAGHRFSQAAVRELGFRWRSDTFDVLINQFKSMQEELTADALFFLFDLDATVCDKIFEKFDELKEATRRDGKRHSVSMQVPGSKSGFTLMVCPMSGVNVDKFRFIAMKRKYSTRSDEWFALMGTEDRSRLFHTCFYDKTPWREDSKWESLGAEE